MNGWPVPWYLLVMAFVGGLGGLGFAYLYFEYVGAVGPLLQGWIGRGAP